MADDIVKQLEWLRNEFYDVDGVTAIVDLATTEIQRLRAQVADLVDAMLKAGMEW